MIRQLCAMVLLVVTFSARADISGRVVRVLDGDTVEVLEPDYAAREAEARRHASGLWSEPGQTEPWRWRSQHQERGSISDAP